MSHIFRLLVVCLFTLSLFCILKWNFNVMKISRQQLLIAWQTGGDSCIQSRSFKCWKLPRPQGGVGDLVAKLHMSVTKLANTFRDMRENENVNPNNASKSTNFVLRYQSGQGVAHSRWSQEAWRLLLLLLLWFLLLLSFSAVGKSLLQKLLKIPLNFAQITEGVQF